MTAKTYSAASSVNRAFKAAVAKLPEAEADALYVTGFEVTKVTAKEFTGTVYLDNVADALSDEAKAALANFDVVYEPSEATLKTNKADAETADAETAEDAPAKNWHKYYTHEVSSFTGVVAFVHGWLDANPNLGRGASVKALQELGVAFGTARTQYQKWFKNRKELGNK